MFHRNAHGNAFDLVILTFDLWQTSPKYPSTWPTCWISGLNVCPFGRESGNRQTYTQCQNYYSRHIKYVGCNEQSFTWSVAQKIKNTLQKMWEKQVSGDTNIFLGFLGVSFHLGFLFMIYHDSGSILEPCVTTLTIFFQKSSIFLVKTTPHS